MGTAQQTRTARVAAESTAAEGAAPMHLHDMNWMDVERYLEKDTRILLITGATEQHAFLSLLTDILIPLRIAEAVAQRENVLIAPALNFGVSRHFYEFPGTISFSRQTFEFAVLEIVESLLHQGFRRFFVLNGHGGNYLPERLADFQMDGVIRVMWHDWWRGPAAHNFAEKHNLVLEHANWGENFPFINRVAESPRTVKEPVPADLLDQGHSARQLLGDGSFGGPYQVDDELMYMLFDSVVDETVEMLRALGSGPIE
jgi:creatinine amidohydrolase